MPAEGRRGVVLVVEDDGDVREALSEIFCAIGYATLEASTQEVARKHLAAGAPLCTVLLDGNVPEKEGEVEKSTVPLARLLRGIFHGLVVAIPADEDRLRELLAVLAPGGRTVGLRKPINLDALEKALNLPPAAAEV